jgi:purine-binding chemotaxis protein CheW
MSNIAEPTHPELARALAGKYLTFTLGGESYGIRVLQVREIIRLVGITAVPQVPHYIKGVINLRGKIIPVVDLRLKLGMNVDRESDQSCIVVVNIASHGGEKRSIGLMVDAVEEVVNIAMEDIEETPDFGNAIDTQCILGLAKIKGAVKALLDIDRILVGEAAWEATGNVG